MTRNYTKQPLRIFVAVGHGGPDPGAVCGDLREADINLSIALLLEQDLRRHGVQVRLSRNVDAQDRLAEEIAECNQYAPDFALAIHTNASMDGTASGFEVYYQQTGWANQQCSHRMATILDRTVGRYCNASTRGLKAGGHLAWLNGIAAPGVLVEGFFLNGPKAAWYSAPPQLSLLARCYARAVLEYYNIPYRSDTAQSVTVKVYHTPQDVRECTCPGFLLNGHYYVQLREYETQRGAYRISYDAHTGIPAVYDPAQFAESAYGEGVVPLCRYATREERIMAGIEWDAEDYDAADWEADAYAFDEYDYTESGQLYQTNTLLH